MITNVVKKSDTRYIYDWNVNNSSLETLTVLIKGGQIVEEVQLRDDLNRRHKLEEVIAPCLSSYGTSYLSPDSIKDLIKDYYSKSPKINDEVSRVFNCEKVKLNNFNYIEGKREKFFKDIVNTYSCVVEGKEGRGGVLMNLDREVWRELKEVSA